MMKKILYSLLLLLAASSFLVQAQEAAVKIDGKLVYLKAGNSLPYWLSDGQTIAPAQNISFLSAMQFSADSASHSLKFDQVFKIASLSTVPAGKAWKIEAIAYDTLISTTSMGAVMMPSGTSASTSSSSSSTSNTPVLYKSPKVFDVAGSYQWMVPPGVTSICVEIWGGGGNGGDKSYNASGGGGGGGGYGYQCFSVVPGTIYNLVVGGAAANSTFSNLVTAFAGSNGISGGNNVNGSGGLGGGSTATVNFTSSTGQTGSFTYSGAGGSAYNGGTGGIRTLGGCSNGTDGTAPGGGGGGSFGSNCGSGGIGGKGASGQVIIYW
jgi:hypothetical protein